LNSTRSGKECGAPTLELSMDGNAPKRESCLLPRSDDAPAKARRFVAAALASWDVADAFGDVLLITSELVTNAVRHAESNVKVSIDLAGERVRLEVADLSEHLPVKAEIGAARDGGWGLHIVEHLCTRWGLEPRRGGKTVWCEVARQPPGVDPTDHA
jgi:anti-sigma regulatory factor (Ser/Thr protein kinase)